MPPQTNSTNYVTVPHQDNFTALVIDEQSDSLRVLSQGFVEQSFRVISGNSLSILSEIPSDLYPDVRAIAVSLSIPGASFSDLYQRLTSLFPLIPLILIGPKDKDDEQSDVAMQLIRLERPIQAEKLAKIIDACRRHARAFDEIVQRQVFLAHPAYIEEPIARIIHDINNQMTGLKGGIDLLGYSIDMIRDPEIQNKFNRYMEQFIQPSLAQIEQLVANWRRLRENRSRPHITIDFVEALRSAVIFSATPLQQSHITFRVDGTDIPLYSQSPLPPHPFHVHANAEQLILSIGYVIQNSVEAIDGRNDGCVLIEVDENEDNMCRLRIYDNGDGISDSIRPQMWRSFFTTKGEWRNGLGLSIAKQIIDKHQGQIEFIQSPLGGAGFQILFAVAEPLSTANEAEIQDQKEA